jgi:NAD(P)-dependent dehydrogenase (short-subunit alcohol dehydrogenase family)
MARPVVAAGRALVSLGVLVDGTQTKGADRQMTEYAVREHTSILETKFGLRGKTAVITGGAGTLCSVMAKGYAQAGANVILWDIRQDALDTKVREILDACGNPAQAAGFRVDLMDEESIAAGLRESVSRFGTIDILINGAGGTRGKTPLIEARLEDLEFVLKLNLLAGCLLPTKHMAKYWIENRIQGTVINIASMAAFNPLSGVWAYSAAKAAVMNQTMAHAKELAPYGIRVNAIAPGFFVAEQNRYLLLNEDGTLTQRGRDVIAHTPMGRFGEPDDLIAAVIFLAGDGARFVSGITLAIDGAYLCQNI